MSIKEAKKRNQILLKNKKDIEYLNALYLDNEKIISNVQNELKEHKQYAYNISSSIQNELKILNNETYNEFIRIYKLSNKNKILFSKINEKVNLFIIIFTIQMAIIAYLVGFIYFNNF